MADEEYDLIPYKDVSDIKRQLEGIRDKREVPLKDLHDAVQKLTSVMSDMLEMFAGAAEQMKLEEKEYENEAKKHEMVVSKMDKLIDQNKTIAEGMVAIVDMVKEKFPEKHQMSRSEDDEESLFKPASEPKPMRNSPQPEWRPQELIIPKFQPQMQPSIPPIMAPQPGPQPSDFGMQMPPMEPTPITDLDFPEEPFSLGEPPKKKSMFGMFK